MRNTKTEGSKGKPKARAGEEHCSLFVSRQRQMSRSSGGGLSTSAIERWPSGPRAPRSAASAALGLYLPELEPPAPERRRRRHTHASTTVGSVTAVRAPSPSPSASAIREIDEGLGEVEVEVEVEAKVLWEVEVEAKVLWEVELELDGEGERDGGSEGLEEKGLPDGVKIRGDTGDTEGGGEEGTAAVDSMPATPPAHQIR